MKTEMWHTHLDVNIAPIPIRQKVVLFYDFLPIEGYSVCLFVCLLFLFKYKFKTRNMSK